MCVDLGDETNEKFVVGLLRPPPGVACTACCVCFFACFHVCLHAATPIDRLVSWVPTDRRLLGGDIFSHVVMSLCVRVACLQERQSCVGAPKQDYRK